MVPLSVLILYTLGPALALDADLFEIENDVELADGAKVFVKQLDVAVDYFQRQKLIVRVLDGAAEVQRGISLVHDLRK